MKISKNILAGATLVGTVIGAGVFGIPYIFAKSGVLVCLAYFLVLGVVVGFLHLFLGEAILRTNQKMRLVGLAELYLGKKAKVLAVGAVFVGVVGSLLVYLILAGDFLQIIFPQMPSMGFSVLFWLIMALVILAGIGTVVVSEFLMTAFLILAGFLIFGFCLPKISLANFTLVSDQNLFLPFGVFFFSLVGWSAVSEASDILANKKNLKKVIIASLVFCVLFYLAFGLSISGVLGQNTTQEAMAGLAAIFQNRFFAILLGLFGFLAVATSYLTLSNYLKNILFLDYKMPRAWGFALALLSPIALFLLGLREFLPVISFLGAFIGLLEGSLILLIFQRAKKQGQRAPEFSIEIPRFFWYFIFVILVLGALSQIIYYF